MQYSNHYAADSQPDTDPADDARAEFHDRTLFALLSAADDLFGLGCYTASELARLVERHLTPAACPYPETVGADPIPI